MWYSVIPVTFHPTLGPLLLLGTVASSRPGPTTRSDLGGPGPGEPVGESEAAGAAGLAIARSKRRREPASSSPQLMAAMAANRASHGLFGSVRQIQKYLLREYRVALPGGSCAYLMILVPEVGMALPSLYESNLRYIEAELCPDIRRRVSVAQMEWFRIDGVREAITSPDGKYDDIRLRLTPHTLEALRKIFAVFSFDRGASSPGRAACAQ